MSNPLYEIPDGIVAYTPSDTANCPAGTIGFYLEGPGSVAVQLRDGSIKVYADLLKHAERFGKIVKIFNTGTTVSAGNVYVMKGGVLKG
jgi:hypothetical protein